MVTVVESAVLTHLQVTAMTAKTAGVEAGLAPTYRLVSVAVLRMMEPPLKGTDLEALSALV